MSSPRSLQRQKELAQRHQSELIGAALRYCAVADWFEAYPCTWRQRISEGEAIAIFNAAEAELRAIGRKVLPRHEQRDPILQCANVPKAAR